MLDESAWVEFKAGGEHLRLLSEHNALGVQASLPLTMSPPRNRLHSPSRWKISEQGPPPNIVANCPSLFPRLVLGILLEFVEVRHVNAQAALLRHFRIARDQLILVVVYRKIEGIGGI